MEKATLQQQFAKFNQYKPEELLPAIDFLQDHDAHEDMILLLRLVKAVFVDNAAGWEQLHAHMLADCQLATKQLPRDIAHRYNNDASIQCQLWSMTDHTTEANPIEPGQWQFYWMLTASEIRPHYSVPKQILQMGSLIAFDRITDKPTSPISLFGTAIGYTVVWPYITKSLTK